MSTPEYDTIALAPAHRAGGGGRSPVDHLDFVVSGTSLLALLGWQRADLIGCLGPWGQPDQQRFTLERLLLRASAELPSGWHLLYVCPECADIGCGAITVAITKEQGCYVWRDFAHENGYEEARRPASFASAGPFYFERTAYWHALSGHVPGGTRAT